MLYLIAGSILVWVAILAVYVEASDLGSPTFSLTTLGALAADGQFSSTFQIWVFPLFMVGFGVLAGLWPFHTWSPDGHVAAPTAVSMLHAGVLMKLGAYGIIRVGVTLLPEGADTWMPVLISLGTVNVLYGAVAAMSQVDLKYVIGYSSVSHMGYVLMGIATLDRIGVGGAVLQMFSHGIMTAPDVPIGGRNIRPCPPPEYQYLERAFQSYESDQFLLCHCRTGVPGVAGA